MKAVWGDRVTTVFPKQGHFASDPRVLEQYPPADVAIERIGDLIALDRGALAPATRPGNQT